MESSSFSIGYLHYNNISCIKIASEREKVVLNWHIERDIDKKMKYMVANRHANGPART